MRVPPSAIEHPEPREQVIVIEVTASKMPRSGSRLKRVAPVEADSVVESNDVAWLEGKLDLEAGIVGNG
jgi:hypothetical protein